MSDTPDTRPGDDPGRPEDDDIAIPGTDGAEVADTPADDTRVQRQRRGFLRRRAVDGDAAPATEHPTEAIPAVAPPPEAEPAVVTVEEEPLPRGPHLRRNRAELVDQREDMLFHLGGLVYDLYQREMLTYPAAVERARRVAEVDDAIREIDAQLVSLADARHARKAGAAPLPAEVGSCVVCRAAFYADARFCMQCGTALWVPAPVGVGPTADAPAAGPVPPASAPPQTPPAADAGHTRILPPVPPAP